MFEKKDWKKGDPILADDLNRIETGIVESNVVIERIKSLSKLENGAKNADIIKAYNALIDAVNGVDPGLQSDAADNPDQDNVEEQKEGE